MDELVKDQPILYLPKFSYFGDYQILLNLKSNVVIRTYDSPDNKLAKKEGRQPDLDSKLQDIIFMCVDKDTLMDLCDLFPQTKDNLERKAKERRRRIIKQKDMNSRKYWRKRGTTLLS